MGGSLLNHAQFIFTAKSLSSDEGPRWHVVEVHLKYPLSTGGNFRVAGWSLLEVLVASWWTGGS